MNFTTSSQYISKREPRHILSGKSGNVGRPTRPENERIRTIAWFSAVQISLGVEEAAEVGHCVQIASDMLAPKGLSGDHKGANRWSRYAKGSETPRQDMISFMNNLAPGSSDVFLRGPNELWDAIWCEKELRLRPEDVQEILDVEPMQIDLQWLYDAIVAWRIRGSIAEIGVLDNFPDGLYEAIMLGLNLPAVKSQLERLKVWEPICEEIRSAERRYLSCDLEKAKEIIMIGRHFAKRGNPIESYLRDPIGFFIAGAEASDFVAQAGFGKLTLVPN